MSGKFRRRVESLEETRQAAGAITAVFLDVPGGGPDLVVQDSVLREVPDGRALLATLDASRVTVCAGIDPRVVCGERKGDIPEPDWV